MIAADSVPATTLKWSPRAQLGHSNADTTAAWSQWEPHISQEHDSGVWGKATTTRTAVGGQSASD